jgi:hypothetical protein
MKFCNTNFETVNFLAYKNIGPISGIWDSVLPLGHHLKSKELLILENSMLSDISFCYLLIYNSGVLSGAVYLQVCSFDQKHFAISDQSGKGLLGKYLIGKERKIVVCGNIFKSEFQGFHFVKDDNQIFEILKSFESSNPLNLKLGMIVLKDYAEELPFSEKASASGFTLFENDQVMNLEINSDWSSIDDYFESLSKKYRQRARKITEAGKKIQKRDLSITEIENFSFEIGRLYGMVVERQQVRPGILNERYFLEMKRTMKELFSVTGYFLEDKILAFSSFILNKDNTLEVHYVGFDQNENDRYALYFNLLFDGISLAIEKSCGVLKLGRTGYDAKANLGAVAQKQKHYYKVKRGLPSIAFQYLKNQYYSNIDESWKKRNPFKIQLEEVNHD